MQKIITIGSFVVINILKNLIGLLRSKIIAIRFGILEIGVLGQLLTFFNFQSQALLFGAGGALNNLLTKHSADEKKFILNSVVFITFLTNIIFIIIAYMFHKDIALLLFKNLDYSKYILYIIIISPILTISKIYEIAYQANKEFSILIKGQLVSISTAIIAVVPLTWYLGIEGVIIDFAIWFLVSLIFFSLNGEIRIASSFRRFSIRLPILKKVLILSLTDFTRNILISVSLIGFRIILVQKLDLKQAGFFQSIWSVSNYIIIITQAFIVYFFPTISSIKGSQQLRLEINNNFKKFVYLIVPLILTILVFPGLILKILFTSEFIVVSTQMQWLVLIKFFEAIYLFYLIVFLAQNRLKKFLSLELLRSVLIIILPGYLIQIFHLNGAVLSIAIAQIISLLLLFVLIRSEDEIQLNRESIKLVFKSITAFLLILLVSEIFNNIYINLILTFGIIIFMFDIKIYWHLLIELYDKIKQNK